ncbi:MAG: hypothetical protein QM564_02305 [Bergeyella sp.]
MKNTFQLKRLASILTVLLMAFSLTSCNRDDDSVDDLPQEEMTNVILKVTDSETGNTVDYNYIIGAASAPVINLTDGKSYLVETVFMNGDEDVTEEIRDAKDEHFLLFDFPKSTINLSRQDPPSSTRTDGTKVGLVTKWDVVTVVNSSSPVVKITLIHEPATVSEAQNGTSWGSVTGGETDAEVTFGLSN